MAACREDFLCGDDFDAVLAIYRSYRYGANASEAVQKIVTGEKDYHKCMLLARYSLHSHSISIIIETGKTSIVAKKNKKTF